MIAGTIHNQIKLQMLDQKWQQKKEDFSKKNKVEMTPEQRNLEQFKEQLKKEREKSSTSEIYAKLQSGGKLTSEEIAYLKENDPESLAEYEKAQAEKKSYEQALKNCKTKEEVERLKMNRMGNFAAQAKSIVNNPYIPKDKKVQLIQRLNNEVCLIRDAHNEFVSTKEFIDLPKEAEIAEENAKETAAKNDAILEEQMEIAEDEFENIDVKSNVGGQGIDSPINEADIPIENEVVDAEKQNAVKPSKPASVEKYVNANEISFESIKHDIEKFLQQNGTANSHVTWEV